MANSSFDISLTQAYSWGHLVNLFLRSKKTQLEVREMSVPFPTCQEHEEDLLALLCTYKASSRSRAWWKLPGRTGPPIRQMGTPQVLSNVERMDFGADQRACFCFL